MLKLVYSGQGRMYYIILESTVVWINQEIRYFSAVVVGEFFNEKPPYDLVHKYHLMKLLSFHDVNIQDCPEAIVNRLNLRESIVSVTKESKYTINGHII